MVSIYTSVRVKQYVDEYESEFRSKLLKLEEQEQNNCDYNTIRFSWQPKYCLLVWICDEHNIFPGSSSSICSVIILINVWQAPSF